MLIIPVEVVSSPDEAPVIVIPEVARVSVALAFTVKYPFIVMAEVRGCRHHRNPFMVGSFEKRAF